MMIKLLKANYLGNMQFALQFSDGAYGAFDLAAYLAKRTGPLLQPLAKEEFVSRAFIDAGALCWPNGLELSPQRLHEAAEFHRIAA